MLTSDLITKLSQESKPVKVLKKPSHWILRLVIFALVYYFIIQTFLGVRSDISEKLLEPSFIIEILLMIILLISSIAAASITIYPDSYQKNYLLKIPYFILTIFAVFLIFEFVSQTKSGLIYQPHHSYRCLICITSFSIIPSLYFFYILRKGININPSKATNLAVIAASTIGCIALKINEQNDDFFHLVIWHYFPVLVFSLIGAAAGKRIFKW